MVSKDKVPLIDVCVYIYIYIYIYILSMFLSVSSSYLLVFGDDRVIRYMGEDDVACGSGEAQSRR